MKIGDYLVEINQTFKSHKTFVISIGLNIIKMKMFVINANGIPRIVNLVICYQGPEREFWDGPKKISRSLFRIHSEETLIWTTDFRNLKT